MCLVLLNGDYRGDVGILGRVVVGGRLEYLSVCMCTSFFLSFFLSFCMLVYTYVL
jgi:hypothetical protein